MVVYTIIFFSMLLFGLSGRTEAFKRYEVRMGKSNCGKDEMKNKHSFRNEVFF